MAPTRAFENLDMAPTIYLVYIGFYITILSMILLMMGKGAIPKQRTSPHKKKKDRKQKNNNGDIEALADARTQWICDLSTVVGKQEIKLRHG